MFSELITYHSRVSTFGWDLVPQIVLSFSRARARSLSIQGEPVCYQCFIAEKSHHSLDFFIVLSASNIIVLICDASILPSFDSLSQVAFSPFILLSIYRDGHASTSVNWPWSFLLCQKNANDIDLSHRWWRPYQTNISLIVFIVPDTLMVLSLSKRVTCIMRQI